MQKLIETQFFCYPKNKNLSVLYTDKKLLKSRLFKALSLQISPKEGALLRLRKTNFGHHLSSLKKNEVVKVKIPESKNLKIGYKNNDKIIFFEFDKENNVIGVFRKENQKIFVNAPFLGYSIVEKYSKKEYFNKRHFIKQALEKRWIEVNENSILHGDFTHFNVLLSDKKSIFFIDKKELVNSVLFDHFYFYSYYMQCLERCKTISNASISIIKKDLQNIIKSICKLDEVPFFLNQININDAIGIIPEEREQKFIEFSNFLTENGN